MASKPHQTLRTISPDAWLKSAGSGLRSPYNRPHQVDTLYGRCVVGMDGYRAHFDWHVELASYPTMPEKFNVGIQTLIAFLDTASYTTIHAEAEYERLRGIIAVCESSKGSRKTGQLSKWAHKDRATAAQYRHFPAAPLPFQARNLPDIWMNYYYLRDALYGFNEPTEFWYQPALPEKNIIGLGVPGYRLALLMPMTGF